MSGDGAPQLDIDGRGMKVEIVASQWHTEVMDGLVNGAVEAAKKAGAKYRVTRVAGAFELTVVAEKLARSGADAVVALGVVVQGETPHFEYVCRSVTDGLTAIAREHMVPVGFGVLTVDTVEQALARAGLEGSIEDKGAESVEAALATALTLDSLG
ncbi:6,7-dimethyl-8-ribityllumazine synthase [Demequina flava]|uniref:6,7-dimethyl-8-ribityllumazine synthase n=1 Tax=Demequina flava TaxID=1095025 RepID=UPI000783335B|nr:6,7-dimethyl-8-ribityllumazine synthase [Demequina flava]